MSDTIISRRSFLTGLAAVGALGWVYDSDTLTARLIRGTCGDIERAVVHLPPVDLSKWNDQSVDVCWVGHATVLLNIFGVHVLTDPVLFNRIGAQLGIATFGRKRIVASAIPPEHLPRIDLVLLSHAHMDHMDLPSLAAIPSTTPVITAPATSDIISGIPFKSVQELKWGESKTVQTQHGRIGLQAVEVKHWGARWGSDDYRGYCGYLLKRGGKTILFGGDTAYTPAFRQLRGKKIDVALMPIGCYGRGTQSHCTPEEAVRMANEAGAEFIVPIHHSTFPLGKEPLAEPLERLENAVPENRIALREVGQTWRLAA